MEASKRNRFLTHGKKKKIPLEKRRRGDLEEKIRRRRPKGVGRTRSHPTCLWIRLLKCLESITRDGGMEDLLEKKI